MHTENVSVISRLFEPRNRIHQAHQMGGVSLVGPPEHSLSSPPLIKADRSSSSILIILTSSFV